MNKDEFLKLYIKHQDDESVTSFNNEIGFSLVSNYPKNTPYYNDGKKMFIKLALLRGKLFYSIDMVKPEYSEDGSVSYVISEGSEYKRKITNFFSDDKEPFIFSEEQKKIIHTIKNKKFTINEFIAILISNHLNDPLFFKRILNSAVDLILKILFWLSDRHYEKIQTSIDRYHFSKDRKLVREDKKIAEPFFNYFHISKNTMLSSLLLITILSFLYLKKLSSLGEFSVSNPFMIIFFFLILFLCEKFSVWLNNKIKEFFETDSSHSFQEKKINFIEQLHNYQYQNKFNLKLK